MISPLLLYFCQYIWKNTWMLCLFECQSVIKTSRRWHFQTVVVDRRLYTGFICQIAMALCIYNHLSDGLHRKFIGFPALQPFDFCPKPDVP